MPINVSSYLAPRVGGTYYLVEDNFVKGGYQSLPSVSARDAIDPLNRKQGMLVYCSDTDKVYKLGADLLAWSEFSSGSGSGTGTGTGSTIAPLTISGFGGICLLNDVTTLSIQGTPNERVTYKMTNNGVQVFSKTITLDVNGVWTELEGTQPLAGVYVQELTFPDRLLMLKTFTKTVQSGNSYSPAIAAYIKANPVSGGSDPDAWFATTKKRFLGDFTGTTMGSRSAFQTKTVNGTTYVHAVPNGGGREAGFVAANVPDMDSTGQGIAMIATASKVGLLSNAVGSSPLPITLAVGARDVLAARADGVVINGGAATTLTVSSDFNTQDYATAVYLATNGPSGGKSNSILQSRGESRILDLIACSNGSSFGSIAISASNLSPAFAAQNYCTVGTPDRQWPNAYLKTATISTSDARLKTDVTPLSAQEIEAAIEICEEFGTYYFLAMLEEKGDAARKHTGTTVQRVIEILKSHGLDPFEYAFVCYDEWPERIEFDTDPDTQEQVARVIPAGSLYSFRASELLFFCMRGTSAAIKDTRKQMAELRSLLAAKQ